ncbi:Predicted arabinose efflux permease, MFS family [Sphingomonas guangdongensis]|uniref:Predicted arabinose efflux permease, MFS family n=2 Tax=Sphingomonas guangdongensis TaxID=1141890 RepID=A0A285R030_9SPHN|nr:Predicted arabinose efflux permease, MFS family [Sphingomonas guangdongensis]
MRADLGWSFADAGALNTGNAAGYLAGALFANGLGGRVGHKTAFVSALLLTSLATGASAVAVSFPALLALRFLAGLSGAVAFVVGAGLTAGFNASPKRSSTLLGLYFAGAGIGVTASALLVPPLLATVGWRGGWLALGALALGATLWAGAVIRRVPPPPLRKLIGGRAWSPGSMTFLLVSYGLYGAGYIAYATFIVAFLRDTEGFNAVAITTFWSVLGLSSVFGAFAWGPILARLRGGLCAAATIGVVAAGTALPIALPSPLASYTSAILFGGSFLAVIASVTSFVRRTTEPEAWTAAIGALTISFGLGQCIGPVLSGAMADGPDGIRPGLWVSVGILIAASVIAALQPEPARKDA